MLYKQVRMRVSYEAYEYLNIAVDENQGSEVPVSMKISSPTYPTARYNWQMQMQRYVNGSWQSIGQFFGYVDYYSPSHRRFTNIATWKNTPCRIAILTADYNGEKVIFSPIFYK